MRTTTTIIAAALIACFAGIGVCIAADHVPSVLSTAVKAKLPALNYTPPFDSRRFVDRIDNPYFPLHPGTTLTYAGIKDGRPAHEVFIVTSARKRILGVNATVVHDMVYEGAKLVEDTWDWYAQDEDGNVWYFGEATKALDDGAWSKEGSWEAGVNGAKAGIHTEAKPAVGNVYAMEFVQGHARDSATVLTLHEPISVPYSSYKKAKLVMEWAIDEPGIYDANYAVPGIGVVKEFAVTGKPETFSLAKVKMQ